jgi:hypothetical protein
MDLIGSVTAEGRRAKDGVPKFDSRAAVTHGCAFRWETV